MTGPSKAMKAAFPPKTNEELADGDYADIVDALANEPANGLQEPERVLLHAAADALRAMPEGERIEGIIIEETRNRTLLFEQRDPDMAVPVAYARATLTIHERKEGER